MTITEEGLEDDSLDHSVREFAELVRKSADWGPGGSQEVAEDVSSALCRMLPGAFVYIRLHDTSSTVAAECAHTPDGPASADRLQDLRGEQESRGVSGAPELRPPSDDPHDTSRVFTQPLGRSAEYGVLVVRSPQPGFPSERDRLLVSTAAILAAAFRARSAGVDAQTRAEEALRGSDARRSAIFEAALDCIVSIDRDGRIIEFNAAAERTFGHRREDVIGREMADVIIPLSLREQHRTGLARYLATGEGPILNRRLEMSAVRSDGTEFPVELTVTALPGDGPSRFTAFLRDITDRKRAEDSMRERQERYELVVAGAEAAIWDWDVQRRRVVYSPRWKALRGLSDEEVSDDEKEWSSRIHADDYARVMAAVQAHFEGRTPVFAEEYRVRHKDGHWVWILDRGIARRDAAGQVIRMAGSETDVTEQKRAEEALRESEARVRHRVEELEKLMDLLPVAVWIARDPTCREIAGNRAGNELLRVQTGQNLSQSAVSEQRPTHFRVRHDGRELRPDELPMQYAAAHGIEVRGFEEEIEFDDGTIVRAYGSAVPLFDERRQVRGAIAAFMDVTDLKRLEKRLQQTVDELAEADDRKDEFLATLAHELRNPLAPIRNAVQIFRAYGPNDPAIRWSQDVIDRQVSHLTRLIDDLLDVNRITRNELELRKERVELAEAVRTAVETSRPLIEQSGHQLTVALPPDPIYLEADLVRLSQVFMNLLTNAAKYMERGGSIQVTAARTDGEIVVRVKDAGVGIPPQMLTRVFEMFFRIDRSLEQAQGGLGVGLALTRRLVEMHGGTIEAHSAGIGEGSEFVVRLPAPTTTQTSPPPPLKNHDEARIRIVRRILVVDDVRDAADSLAIALRLSGHEVVTAYDGVEAIAVAEQFRPEVMVLDIGMPGLNGYEACRRIREQTWGKEMMLIALTGWGGPEDQRRAIEAGFDSKLVKPVDPTAILQLLSELTGS